jgi:membrane associated rhomboid family serine protease
VTPRVRILLFATVGAYFAQETVPHFYESLVFVPRLILMRPWTVVGYMFLHGGLMHLVFNMIALFFFGPRVEDRLGPTRFTILYFLSGITGALLSFAFSFGSNIIGASAGVFGVMLAFAYYWPKAEILIWGILPVQARVLVIVTTVISIWAGLSGGGGGVAHFAHLGGYAGAYLYLKWTERGRKDFRRRAEASVRPIKSAGSRMPPKVDLTNVHELNKEEVNRILDKISAEGMGSLTPQERTFLSNFVPPDDRQ